MVNKTKGRSGHCEVRVTGLGPTEWRHLGWSPGAIAALMLPFFLGSCFLQHPISKSFPEPPPPESLPVVPDGPSLNVLVLGDWGTGGDGQRELAVNMAATHAADPPAFILTVGDNIYPDGVADVDDPLWESHFESVYAGPFWEAMPFQAVLGNHDHYGNPDAQVEYSDLSERWNMPARYYAFEESVPGGGSALFLALDTQPFFKEDSVETRVQQQWADSVLNASGAEWTVVAGHHPAVTGGWHKSNTDIQAAIWPVIMGRSHVYVSGHNHSTEFLTTAIGTPQAVCGGGGGTDNAYRVGTTEGSLDHFTNGGWCFLRIWPDLMAVDLHDREGGVQFRYLIER